MNNFEEPHQYIESKARHMYRNLFPSKETSWIHYQAPKAHLVFVLSGLTKNAVIRKRRLLCRQEHFSISANEKSSQHQLFKIRSKDKVVRGVLSREGWETQSFSAFGDGQLNVGIA